MKNKTTIIYIILLLMSLFLLSGCKEKVQQEAAAPMSTEEASTGSGSVVSASDMPAADEDTSADESREASAESACPSVSGKLSVKNGRLTDRTGNAVQLRGISTHGLAWFPDYVNEDCFKQLRQWGANVIRLAMYTAEYGGYCTGGDQEALKIRIKNGVKYAAAQDMYVIIDWHILSDGNPNTYKDEAKAFFSEMSSTYADADHVLYEICNEPNGGTSWSDIKSYAEEIIPVIRANDKDAIIIVGTPNWSQYVDEAAADPITGYDNIMYALHFYAATHKEELRNKMISAAEEGLPIFVSEYGICDASGNGNIDETQANLWVEAMDKYGISYVAWNLSNKEESSAILQSSCTKTSDFDENDLSASGKWLYQMFINAKETGIKNTFETTGTDNAVTQGDNTENNPTTEQISTVWNSDSFENTVVLINSWEAGGEMVYQYDLTMKNTSGSNCSSWALDIVFDAEINLMDCWNGEFTVDGSTLHITSKDYNAAVAIGGSVADIGFIVSGGTIRSEK